MPRLRPVRLAALALAVACAVPDGGEEEPRERGFAGEGGDDDHHHHHHHGRGGAPGGAGHGGEGGEHQHGGAGGEDQHGGGGGSPGGAGGGGGDGTACAPVESPSACGNEGSIVRVLARLPEDARAIHGKLKLNLRHVRSGALDGGGAPHVPLEGRAPAFPMHLGPGDSRTVWLDMCAGGERWSEENCEFNLFVWMDADDDGVPDPGERTGRRIVNVSCRDASPCHEIDLDCTDGPACVAVDEPAVCACAASGCGSPLAVCR